ncbi:unnamed protein product, partial [Polarella glacialis]
MSAFAAASRPSTPWRPSTPGDLAPMALAPVSTEPKVRPPPLPRAPSLPVFSDSSALQLSEPAQRTGPREVHRSEADWWKHSQHRGPLGLGGSSAANFDLHYCEDKLYILDARQIRAEQRIEELAALLDSVAEAQDGQAHRIDGLVDTCQVAQDRIHKLHDVQAAMAVDIKVASQLADDAYKRQYQGFDSTELCE